MQLSNSNFETLETESSVLFFASAFVSVSASAFSTHWLTKRLLTCLIAASIAMGMSNSAVCQVESYAVEQAVFNVPNSTDAKIGSGRSEKLLLQPAARPSLTFGRDSLKIQSALKPLDAKFANCTVVLQTQYGHKSLGTIISKQGYIVGKYSELNGAKFSCHIGDKKVSGQSIAYHRYHDLILIKVEPEDLGESQPISFSRNLLDAKVGNMVVSVGSEISSPKLGVVSVLPQTFGIEQPTLEDGIDLGLTVSPFVVTKSVPVSGGSQILKGLEVQRVYPRSVSERTGIFVGDLLQAVNGVEVSSRFELEKFAKSLRVGQRVSVKVFREGKTQTLSTRIESFAPKMLHDRWGGGPFSDRRFGFEKFISHDSVIDPGQCGGPLVDLHGDVLGINIARAMRVATFAIPLKEVENFVRIVKPGIELVYDR